MRVSPGAPDLVASPDGAFVASAGARLRLFAVESRAEAASTPLDGPADLAFLSSDRVLALVVGDGHSQVLGFALPSLERVASLQLEGRLRLLGCVAGRALVATESLEQPR